MDRGKCAILPVKRGGELTLAPDVLTLPGRRGLVKRESWLAQGRPVPIPHRPWLSHFITDRFPPRGGSRTQTEEGNGA